MKPFVLSMFLITHDPKSQAPPALEFFDTVTQCSEGLADWVAKIMDIDSRIHPRLSGVRLPDDQNHVVYPIVIAGRYVALCTPSTVLPNADWVYNSP